MKWSFISVCLVLVLVIFISIPDTALAVKEQKVSNYGGGHQVWFEAEAFDARDSDTGYKLAKAEAGINTPPIPSVMP